VGSDQLSEYSVIEIGDNSAREGIGVGNWFNPGIGVRNNRLPFIGTNFRRARLTGFDETPRKSL
jgi:hypothetical protein